MFETKKHVVEVTEANFQAEILEYSRKRPVIVDFWAPWCQPCRTLGPMLESLAKKYNGAFRLAKIDVDANQGLAMAFRVQSIPTVVAVYQGQLVDQFMGALPQAELQRFIDGVLQAAGMENDEEEEDEVPKDPRKAEAYWRAKLKADEKDSKAMLALGRLLVGEGKTDEAKTLLQKITANQEGYDDAQATLSMLELLTKVGEAGGESAIRDRLSQDPADETLRYLVACADAGRGRYVHALEALIDLVAKGKKELRDDAKKAASIVFMVAGRGDDAVEALRRRLALLLY